ncbi:hypothetical protein K1719_025570 [Acacia pycnantha]|nr:hypothetical protein K1719_025570 [Acacia pycnantha]
MEGKPGKLKFTAEEYSTWCLPWMNSLIIKVLGASFPTYVIRDRVNRMWRPKNPLKIIPLSNGYYIVSFSNKEDREYDFQEGPWMIEDHYLIVQRWRPNFNPWKADLTCNIAAWIRLPDVPFEFYNVESLRRIGNMVGRMIKIDRSTSIYNKGGFARICVEIDLKKPLLPTYMVFGEERSIIYEGLHHVCFMCGKCGHQKNACPLNQVQEQVSPTEQVNEVVSTGVTGGDQAAGVIEGSNPGSVSNIGVSNGKTCDGAVCEGSRKKESAPGGGSSVVTGGDVIEGNPFGKLRILRRDFRGAVSTSGIKKEKHESRDLATGQGIIEGKRGVRDSRQVLKKNNDGVMMTAPNDQEALTKGKIPLKSEWIQVGANVRTQAKGKLEEKRRRPQVNGDIQNGGTPHADLVEPTPGIRADKPGLVLGTDKFEAGYHGTPTHVLTNPRVHDNVPHIAQQDEAMPDQDKAEGEVFAPHQNPTVSQ